MSKYESFGVDKEKQASEPTLVEKAQQAEAKAKKESGNGALVSPEEIERVAVHTTHHHQDYIRREPQITGHSRLEESEHGAGVVPQPESK